MSELWTCYHLPPGRGSQRPVIRNVPLELAKTTASFELKAARGEAHGDWELLGEVWRLVASTGMYTVERAYPPSSSL